MHIDKVILKLLLEKIKEFHNSDNIPKKKIDIIKSLSNILVNVTKIKKKISYNDHLLKQNLNQIVDDYLAKL